MKWLSKLAGKAAGVDLDSASEAFERAAGAVKQFKFTGGDEAAFRQKQAETLAEIDKAQIQLNMSGKSPSWRDSIGKACAVSFWMMYAINPTVLLLFAIIGEVTPVDFDIEHWKDIINTIYDPQILAGFTPIIFGMLGLGAMRSYDKKNAPVQGQRRKNLKAAVKAVKRLMREGFTENKAQEVVNDIFDDA